MDHTHICRTRVSTNHLESQIDFLPFDVLTKQSIGIRQQKTIGQFSSVINAWSGFSAPSVVVLVISIVGKVSLTRKSFKLFYLSTTVLLSHLVSSQTKVSSATLECVDVYYTYRLHAMPFREGQANKDQFEISWNPSLHPVISQIFPYASGQR